MEHLQIRSFSTFKDEVRYKTGNPYTDEKGNAYFMSDVIAGHILLFMVTIGENFGRHANSFVPLCNRMPVMQWDALLVTFLKAKVIIEKFSWPTTLFVPYFMFIIII